MPNTQKSQALFEEAKNYFPGGVNSPVRAFRSVGGTPLFITKGDGAYVWDADGNRYLDFCASWGPLILGHNNPYVRESVIETIQHGTSFGAPTVQENELARLIIENHRFIEKLRFVSSGTEAVMSAIRLARGYTKRDKYIKFEGCYHGHADHLLVKAGSGLVTFGETSSAGVPKSFVDETIVLPLFNEAAVHEAFSQFEGQIAAIIIEPVPANNGLLLQTRKFLNFLRESCDQHGALLIFDEVISGFRVGFEGAAGLYRVAPDILTFGKIIGGGLPVGAYGASAAIMSTISPEGPVYQAGTLSGNPVAMSAGKAQIEQLLADKFYRKMAKKTAAFVRVIRKHIQEKAYPVKVFQIGSVFWISFSERKHVRAAHEIDTNSMKHFKEFYHYMLDNGLYLGPSGYEVGFVSAVHSPEELQEAAGIINAGLDQIFGCS
ncbi:MAG: glutamate-1-semialdehyde 2,1-aminomutase [Bacteroidia bacterium]